MGKVFSGSNDGMMNQETEYIYGSNNSKFILVYTVRFSPQIRRKKQLYGK
jgi:hypothetical protein